MRRSYAMCIILKINLSCGCRGCRKKLCNSLEGIAGVEQAKVGDEEATIMVCGKGFDEAEILRRIKKRKRRSEVEVVSRIVHNVSEPVHDIDAGGRSVDAEGVQPQPTLKPKPELKPEISKPEPEPEPLKPKQTPEPELKGGPRKVDTLVTERTLEEFQGVKIRTRVTTSQDVCTCIRVEETRFIINKYCHSAQPTILV